MAEIRHLEYRHDVIFFCWGWSDLYKILETGAEWHVDCGDVSKSKPDVEFQYGGRLGEFNGMSSQSHVSHCRVLPLGEFTVTIPEPHATLQGVRIPSALLKIVFATFYFFLFLMQFRLWRAAAFVSSPIHLSWYLILTWRCCRKIRPTQFAIFTWMVKLQIAVVFSTLHSEGFPLIMRFTWH